MKVTSFIVCLLSAVTVFAEGDIDQPAAVLPEIISSSDVPIDGFNSIPDSNIAATQLENILLENEQIQDKLSLNAQVLLDLEETHKQSIEGLNEVIRQQQLDTIPDSNVAAIQLENILLENEQIKAKLSLNAQVLLDLEETHKQSIEGLNEVIRQQQLEFQNSLEALKKDDNAAAVSVAETASSHTKTVNSIKDELSQCTNLLEESKDVASITDQKLRILDEELLTAKTSTDQCNAQSGLLKIAGDELSIAKTSSEQCNKQSELLSGINQELTARIDLLEKESESKKLEESLKKESTKEPEHEENVYLKSLNEHLSTFQKKFVDIYASIESYSQEKVGAVKSYVNVTLLPYYHNDLQPQMMTLHKDFGTKVTAVTSQIAPFIIATKTQIGDLYLANVMPSIINAGKYLESASNEFWPQIYKIVETIQKYYFDVVVPYFYNDVLPQIQLGIKLVRAQFLQGYKKAGELGVIFVMPTYNEVLLPFYDANMKEHVITIRETLSTFYKTNLKEFVDTNIEPVVSSVSIKFNQFADELKDEKSEIRKNLDNVMVLLKRDVGKIQKFFGSYYSDSIEYLNSNELIKKQFGKNTKILVMTFVNGTLFYCFIIFLQLMRLVMIRSFKIKKLRREEKDKLNEIPVAVAVPISN